MIVIIYFLSQTFIKDSFANTISYINRKTDNPLKLLGRLEDDYCVVLVLSYVMLNQTINSLL